MGERVVLHIGTMKSGTSFIQSVLAQSQDTLADDGVGFLGGTFPRQARAVREVLQKPDKPKQDKPSWGELAASAKAYEGRTSVVSMEFLSFARRPQHLDQLLQPLAGLQVDVVVTVRDQFRAIPAQWQTFTRNLGLEDWPTYLRQIESSRLGRRKTEAYRTYHRAQDVATILDRWGSRPEVHEVAVATVPPPGAPREELWRRFCEAARIPSTTPALDEVRENPSLGHASCEYLRRLNHHLTDVPPRTYRRGIRPLAREVLVHLRHDEGRPELDRRAAGFARTMNERLRGAVHERSHRLVGSVDDLPLPEDLAPHPRSLPPVATDQLVRAGSLVWDHLAARLDDDPGPAPAGLDELVAGGAILLRRVNGWRR